MHAADLRWLSLFSWQLPLLALALQLSCTDLRRHESASSSTRSFCAGGLSPLRSLRRALHRARDP